MITEYDQKNEYVEKQDKQERQYNSFEKIKFSEVKLK
jgi:hypothetical protein